MPSASRESPGLRARRPAYRFFFHALCVLPLFCPTARRLQENKTIFQKLDEELTTEVHKLDSEIAHLTAAAIGKFMQLQAKKAHSLLEIYSSALDSIGVAPAAAAAGGGGDEGASAPAAE